MKPLRSPFAVLLASLAALTMTASPVMARGDWGRHHRHHHGRGGGIDGGDILAGLLVIGGIAAIASAASKSDRRDERAEHPYGYPGGPEPRDGYRGADYGDPGYGPDYADDEAPYGEAPYGNPADGNTGQGGFNGQGGFDMAADACSAEIEQDGMRRIRSVGNVSRMGGRYSVEGRLEDGRGYACSIDDAGQIRSVAVDGRAMI